MIRFAYTILYVQDVAKSASFYQQVFELPIKFIAEGNVYAELITGSTTLSLAAVDFAGKNFSGGFTEANNNNKPFATEIGFATDDVDGLYNKAIAAGAIAVAPPASKPWGQVVAYIRDLDGFLVEICTEMP